MCYNWLVHLTPNYPTHVTLQKYRTKLFVILLFPKHNQSHYLSNCSQITVPQAWEHRAAVSSGIPGSCRWSACPSGQPRRSTWWEPSCSHWSSKCCPWWSDPCASCPCWSVIGLCSAPVVHTHTKRNLNPIGMTQRKPLDVTLDAKK